ncbi:Mur ligase family protein [Staphylococcus simulans]|uniref:Mur ligase family protein n=1 Tax=Staphylococcus simulans TaxID=1286 RepID=UPI000D1FB4AE|nr:Mur ligase family protein [Staphylococcus simulans]PTJ92256.1 hypothetical protein BU032_02880 [Staphylococcus simulans]
MYTLETIAQILDTELLDAQGKEQNPIDDFEYQMLHVKSESTAFISISEASWKQYLKKSKVMKDGNAQIPKDVSKIGLIITETYVEDLAHQIPQIVVRNAIKAMKILALHIRKHYHNPVIALTGSMGKSSTRLMLSAALQPYKVQQNRGNSNTRSAIYLHMCKLASNPDIAVFETSLNALNNRGNMAEVLKPQIAIVTGIGSAHLSTIGSTEEIVAFKSRIFAGLNQDGIAIYNGDTLHQNELKQAASTHTKHVYRYSTEDNSADIYTTQIKPVKKAVEVTTNDGYQFEVPSVSKGMVENALAVLLTLKHLKVDVKQQLKQLAQTQLFKKVLEFRPVKSLHEEATVLDDTHNASLPAMLNAIDAFNSQAPFFKGHKIIALGQISDLGEQTDRVHAELVPALEQSEADYILCMDQPLRKVVNKVKGKHITWYHNKDLMLKDLCYLINQDALVLMKSSVTQTEFPKVASQLQNALLHYERSGDEEKHFEAAASQGRAYLIYNLETDQIETQSNRYGSATIEGLTPIIYYLDAKQREVQNYTVTLKQWPTNDDTYYEGMQLSWGDLVEAMTDAPHPSLVYQLAHELYPTHQARKRHVQELVKQLKMSDSVAINLTGRFRMKERQTFSVDDLLALLKYGQNQLFENDKGGIVIGEYGRHGILKEGKQVIIFTGFESEDEAKSYLSRKV